MCFQDFCKIRTARARGIPGQPRLPASPKDRGQSKREDLTEKSTPDRPRGGPPARSGLRPGRGARGVGARKQCDRDHMALPDSMTASPLSPSPCRGRHLLSRRAGVSMQSRRRSRACLLLRRRTGCCAFATLIHESRSGRSNSTRFVDNGKNNVGKSAPLQAGYMTANRIAKSCKRVAARRSKTRLRELRVCKRQA
jgi:hypothetical protein